jgi:hypothetical protein
MNIRRTEIKSSTPRIHRLRIRWPRPGISIPPTHAKAVTAWLSGLRMIDFSTPAVKCCADSKGALGESSFNITEVEAYRLENFVSTVFSPD